MSSIDHAKTLAQLLLSRGWKLALAESCTGGLVCATLTELSGSSEWFERGYITYSNQAKTECLGAIRDAAGANIVSCETKLFSGDRQSIRQQATEHALAGLLQLLNH